MSFKFFVALVLVSIETKLRKISLNSKSIGEIKVQVSRNLKLGAFDQSKKNWRPKLKMNKWMNKLMNKYG